MWIFYRSICKIMAEIHPHSPGLQQTKIIFPCTAISPCRGRKRDVTCHTNTPCSQWSSQKDSPLPSPFSYVKWKLDPPRIKTTSPSSVLLPATCHLPRELPLCLLATLVHPRRSAGLLRVSQVLAGQVCGKHCDFRAWWQWHPQTRLNT